MWKKVKVQNKENHVWFQSAATDCHGVAKAENIFNELNNNHQAMISDAVYAMKKKARKCLRAMGGTFEGRRV